MTAISTRIPYLPARIEGLADLATNLWWSWSLDARAIFRTIDEPLWQLIKHNPHRAAAPGGSGSPRCLRRRSRFPGAIRPGHGRPSAGWKPRPEHLVSPSTIPAADQPIAYFCAEFGLHNSVPIYSGGLGILAGDHCKTASDLGRAAGRRGAVLHQGLLRPAAAARRLAGGQRRPASIPRSLRSSG